MTRLRPRVTVEDFDAVLFDLDGVLTSTARVHSVCWKKMFDAFLQQRAAETGGKFTPFDPDADYKCYVDGKPRYDGVRSFLESRGIRLPHGDPGDPPGTSSACGLGNRKDRLFHEVLKAEGAEAYEGTVRWARDLRSRGMKTAVVSSSKNCKAILEAAAIDRLFDARMDGEIAARLGIPGKPAPDTYLKAAEELGVSPERAVVVEDALSGVQAGRRGGFGLVIGVDRHADADALRDHGADMVVADLAEMLDDGPDRRPAFGKDLS